ncbi:MAG: hypothetical protein LBK26_00900 [Rickettsiales bacterium]|jgi:hypothetical protein|nr:hypothetical protein [Rickettsiales bacterium]
MKNRNLINLVKIVILSTVFTASALLSSCEKEEPIPEPQPPVEKNDTVYVKLSGISDFQSCKSVLESSDEKKTYMLDMTGNIPADSIDIAGILKQSKDLIRGKTNVKFNDNGHGTFPDTEAGRTLVFQDWNDGMKLPLKDSPATGLQYMAATVEDSVLFKDNTGMIMNVRRIQEQQKPGEEDVVFNISSKQDLAARQSEIIETIASIGEYRIFLDIANDIAVDDSDMEMLGGYNNEKIAVTGFGRIVPAHPGVNASARALKPFNLLARNGENYFFISGENGAKEFGGTDYAICTDTISGSRYEAGETNLAAQKVFVDKDGLDMRALARAATSFLPGAAARLIVTDLSHTEKRRIAHLNNENMSIIMDLAVKEFYDRSYNTYNDETLDEDQIAQMGYKYIAVYEVIIEQSETVDAYYATGLVNISPMSVDLSDGKLQDMDKNNKSGLLQVLEKAYLDRNGMHSDPLPEIIGIPADKKFAVTFSSAPVFKDTWADNSGYKLVYRTTFENLSDMLALFVSGSEVQYESQLFVMTQYNDFTKKGEFVTFLQNKNSSIQGNDFLIAPAANFLTVMEEQKSLGR